MLACRQPALQQTPVREQNSSKLQPVSIGKPQAARQTAEQAEQAEQRASPRTPPVKEQAMEAALKLLLVEGDKS